MTWSSEQFFTTWAKHSVEREAAIVREVIKGNVPSWTHDLHGVGVTDVSPDYLAIGADDDFVRVPLTPYAAAYLCEHFGYHLPKPELIDRIWDFSLRKLKPLTETWNYKGPAGYGQLGLNYRLHSKKIDAQLGADIGKVLVSGQKKDLVGTARLGRVTLYGWQNQSTGKPIQPVYAGHDSAYCDYSHGVRFVKPCQSSGLPFAETYPAQFLKEVKK